MSSPNQRNPLCVIVGGGPAGMMTGYMLARGGVEVTVLEKHKDFFRDFRGDTIHPSTLDVVAELGLLAEFQKRPHQEVREISVDIEGRLFELADLRHVPTHCKFLALMPQWDFLDMLAQGAKRFPSFHLAMETEAVDLLWDGQRVAGVKAKAGNEARDIRADLVIAADGRHSAIRKKAQLPIKEIGAPIDVLWLRLSRKEADPTAPMGRVVQGGFFVMIYRGDYWQCAVVIAKGGYAAIRAKGIESFRARLAELAGFAADRVDEIESWDDVKLLTVAVDRLKNWARPGLLAIGDAAHAMSPIGGIGINLAIQDAVATANILGPILLRWAPQLSDLQKVVARREFPTRVTQWLQVQVQERVLKPALDAQTAIKAPWPIKLLGAVPYLQRLPARFIGVGVRPEHVRFGGEAA